MKKIFLSVATLTVAFAFGQKKEVAAAFKAIEAGDVATTNAQIAQAESAMGDKTYLLEPAVLEQYYYAKGLALLKSGKTAEGASYLGKINDLAKNMIYAGKDSSKNKVYYVGKQAADASGVQGLKEESYTPTLNGKLISSLSPGIEAANKAATDAFNSKNFAVAAPKFQEVYNLLKATGQDNKLYLYYSALSYAQTDKKSEAIDLYNQLIDSGFTGSETNYLAVNMKSGKVDNLNKTSWEWYKKMGDTSDYKEFKKEVTPSKESEFYQFNAELLLDADRAVDAVALIEKGLKKFPTNLPLLELQGRAYLKAGKTEEYVKNLRLQISKTPDDPYKYFNLGVMLSKDPAKMSEAMDAYKKSTDLKPDLSVAWQNMFSLTIGEDGKTVEAYNSARKAGKIEVANKIMDERRVRMVAALPYAEKWYQYSPQDIDAVSTLKGLYFSTKNEVKYIEFKAKEDAMKAGIN
ncbi:tetratricopeptide repeat protein [Kaistella carnis]|uniref:tetratricopeptide repeat protein n=1 Tax=Kaistella carnis TaxID=1241979 RepID=UPI0028A17F66|nr:hypothetical protein [Kaistella carnis]